MASNYKLFHTLYTTFTQEKHLNPVKKMKNMSTFFGADACFQKIFLRVNLEAFMYSLCV